MEADSAMIIRAAAGCPVARVYEWSRPALSFPRSANLAKIRTSWLEESGISVVRRPTGGGILVHGWDLSFSVAVPGKHPAAAGSISAAGRLLASPVLEALCSMGYDVAFREKESPAACGHVPGICFLQRSDLDIMMGKRKVAAFAQRRTSEVIFQHGSVEIEPFSEVLVEKLVQAGVGTKEDWSRVQDGTTWLDSVKPVDKAFLAGAIVRFTTAILGFAPAA